MGVRHGLWAALLDRPRLLTLLDQGVVAVTSFATALLLGRICGQEELGLYLLGLTVMGLVMEFQEVLIWSPYTYFRPRTEAPQLPAYTGSALLQQLGLSLLALPPLGLAVQVLSRGSGPPGLEPFLGTLLVAGTFIYLQEFSRRMCFAGLEMEKALGLDLLAAFVRLGGLSLLSWLGILSARRALWVLAVAGAAAGACWLWGVRRSLAFSPAAVRETLGRHWSFGRWILGGNLSLNLSNYAFPWFLAVWGDLTAVGLLAACQSTVALVNPLVVGCRNFLTPAAARVFAAGSAWERRHFVLTNTAFVGGVVGSLCLMLMIFGGRLLELLYGPPYGGQGLLVALLSAQALVGALPLAVDCGIWALGRPDLNCRIYLLRLLATLSLGLFLVYFLGLPGVAVGLLFNSLLVLILQAWCYARLNSARP
jgi:O-antigen/teichoic acid export membrane protein